VVTKLDRQRLLRGTAPRVDPPRTAVRDAVHAHRCAGTDPISRAARRDLPGVVHEALQTAERDLQRSLPGAAPSPTAHHDHSFSADDFSVDSVHAADVTRRGQRPERVSSS
jgi:hypothetical protein